MHVLLVKDAWTGHGLCEEGVGSPELAIFRDVALIQQVSGRGRRLKLV